ncbi:MAG TPA: response regulator [Holophagaceae bacterium]
MIPECVLLVDDDPVMRETLGEALAKRGYTIEVSSSAEAALERMGQREFSVVVTDLNMPGGASGLDLMSAIRQRFPETLCVLVTGFATLDTSIQALKQGAYDLIQKPFQIAEIEVVLDRALDHARLLRKLAAYREELEARIYARTRELREVQREALELCDLTTRAQDADTLTAAVIPFLDRIEARWSPDGLACYQGDGEGPVCLVQRGPRPLPARLPGLPRPRPGLGYLEEHGIPLGGTAWLYLGFIDRSAFSPTDPAFQLLVRHLELALRVR